MLFVRGAKQLVTMRGPCPRRGADLSDLGVIPDGALLIDGELIDEVGPTRRIENLAKARNARVIDATGKVVLPGFVDSHTRIVFAAAELRRFEESIAAAGAAPPDWESGPARTGKSLRGVSLKTLRERSRRWAFLAAAYGTTTIEARSGGGADRSTELKGLKAANAVDGDPLDVRVAYVATRAAEADGGESSEDIGERIDAVLERACRRRLVYALDAECGPRGLSLAEARDALERARRYRLVRKVQAERGERNGAARLAVEMEALSADHLEHISRADIDLLARSDTIATLLPGVVYHRGADRYPPARELIDRGAAVALATGFGPDYSPTLSMPMALSLACRQMRMMPEEAIAAATINGAAAAGQERHAGSLEPGKRADFALFDVADYREIPYYFAVNLCVMTVKRGRIIYRAGTIPPPQPALRRRRRA